MGSWFSNIHIRKNETATEEAIEKYISNFMAAKHYLPCTSEIDADGAIAIVASEDCRWISIYSDLLSLEEPSQCAEIMVPLSSELHTDVLGISCFDSDYLYLNLINTSDKTDAWIGMGSASGLGIKRRSGISAWKKKVTDFQAFSESAKKEYVFAEEFLAAVERCLELPTVQSSASYEYLKDFELDKKAKYFYFKLPENMKSKEPVKLVPRMYSGMPCFLDKPSVVDGINVGGESRGLSVYFIGPYVENDEITFSDVCFVKWNNNQTESIPFDLIKVQLSDGQWAYYYHDPGFRIPSKVDDRLPMSKRMRVENERSIIVRFVPHGNPRKLLDITVVLVPDWNPEGQTGWNAWHGWGSKKAFMEQFNATWDKHRAWCPNPNTCPPILKEEDFD